MPKEFLCCCCCLCERNYCNWNDERRENVLYTLNYFYDDERYMFIWSIKWHIWNGTIGKTTFLIQTKVCRIWFNKWYLQQISSIMFFFYFFLCCFDRWKIDGKNIDDSCCLIIFNQTFSWCEKKEKKIEKKTVDHIENAKWFATAFWWN